LIQEETVTRKEVRSGSYGHSMYLLEQARYREPAPNPSKTLLFVEALIQGGRLQQVRRTRFRVGVNSCVYFLSRASKAKNLRPLRVTKHAYSVKSGFLIQGEKAATRAGGQGGVLGQWCYYPSRTKNMHCAQSRVKTCLVVKAWFQGG